MDIYIVLNKYYLQMFLFSCCKQAESNKGYAVKTIDQNKKQTTKFVQNLSDIKKNAIENNRIIVHKLQKSPYDQLIKQYSGTNKKWTDTQFPPEAQSLGVIENVNSSQWKRITDIVNKPALFQGKIEPKDVIQGNLGDCYLLSALAALAEDENRIKNVFGSLQYNPNGIYKVTMRIDGIIQEILVDDYIPVNSHGHPLFCQTNKDQFWVLIIQKAWAKAHGSYANIVSGNPTEVFKAITYAPSQLKFVKPSEQEREKLWRVILNRAVKNNPCCCGTDDNQEYDWDKLGLVPAHAYTLIHAAVLHHEQKGQYRMMIIRNPWGKTEWEGEGSEGDQQFWSNIVSSKDRDVFNQYRNQCNDGIFFMKYEDFCKYFTQTHFCLQEPHGNYISQELFCDKKHATLYTLEISKQGQYIFELHQSGIRGQDTHKLEDGLCRSTLLLAQQQGQSYKFIEANMKYNEQDLTMATYLYPGKYVLYAKLDPSRKYGEVPQKSSVSLYSVQFSDLVPVQQKSYPNFLNKVFLNYARSHKRQSYSNDQMWISWKLMFQQGGFAFIAFGNNQSSGKKFHITFDQDEFTSLHFKLKKPFKGKKDKQVLQIYPGEQKIIMTRVCNTQVKLLKFPPQLGINVKRMNEVQPLQ